MSAVSTASRGRKLRAKWRAARMVCKAEVRLSIDTSISGGSAQTWVADSPRNPAGPSSDRAVTTVLPVARLPIARQKARGSMIGAAGGAGSFMRVLRRPYDVILEIARAVGLRPQADLARYRFRQRVFECELAVDVGFEVGACDGHLQVMPLVAGEMPWLPSRAALDHFPNAVTEGPEGDVVFGVVVTSAEPIAVGLDVEQNARAAVEVAG